MEVMIRLILRSQLPPAEQPNRPVRDRTSDLIDDDPDRPLFLAKAGEILAANGVRFEISGFFEKPLPVFTDSELVDFLERLPGLLRFLEAPSLETFSVGLWEQGIETEFLFLWLVIASRFVGQIFSRPNQTTK